MVRASKCRSPTTASRTWRQRQSSCRCCASLARVPPAASRASSRGLRCRQCCWTRMPGGSTPAASHRPAFSMAASLHAEVLSARCQSRKPLVPSRAVEPKLAVVCRTEPPVCFFWKCCSVQLCVGCLHCRACQSHYCCSLLASLAGILGRNVFASHQLCVTALAVLPHLSQMYGEHQFWRPNLLRSSAMSFQGAAASRAYRLW